MTPSTDDGQQPDRAPGPAGPSGGEERRPGTRQAAASRAITGASDGTAPAAGGLPPPVLVPAARNRARARGRIAFRLAVHLAVWAPFLVSVVQGARLGWRPVGDGAAIALRSWDVLTAHGPLVGQANRLAHGTFDLGPLQYWLQSVPVHLDPRYGLLWGAALGCMIASSLAVEAAWSALGWPGGLLAAGAVLGITAWQPMIALRPFWNPWFGAMFFLAALAAGWAVLSGRRRWWVVLVITGSVASQAHLMYALPSVALILVALAVTVADCLSAKAGYGGVIAGLLAGVGCWIAPVIQEFTGRPGNMTLLLHSQGRGRLTGLTFGLKTVSAAAQPPPLWWTSSHALARAQVSGLIAQRTAGFAVAALAAVAAVLVIAAPRLRSRRLAALAAVTLLADAATVVTYAGIPVKNTSLITLDYLAVITYPLGVLIWLTVGSAAVLTGRRVIGRLRTALAGGRGIRAGGAAVAAAAVLLAVTSSLAVAQQAPAADAQRGNAVGLAAARVERALPGQPVALWVTDGRLPAPGGLTLGLVWSLRADGYHPELISHRSARELGPLYLYAGQRIPLVIVHVRGAQVSVRVRPFSAGMVQRVRRGPGRRRTSRPRSRVRGGSAMVPSWQCGWLPGLRRQPSAKIRRRASTGIACSTLPERPVTVVAISSELSTASSLASTTASKNGPRSAPWIAGSVIRTRPPQSPRDPVAQARKISPLPWPATEPVRARPRPTRRASRLQAAWSSGASVTTTPMHDPSPGPGRGAPPEPKPKREPWS